jgi:hypothetical protein
MRFRVFVTTSDCGLDRTGSTLMARVLNTGMENEVDCDGFDCADVFELDG